MDDLRVPLENLLRDAAECRLISDLATDAVKRDRFARLADYHNLRAGQLQRARDKQLAGKPSA